MAICNAYSALEDFAHAVAANSPEQPSVYDQLFNTFRITSGTLNLLYRSGYISRL